MSAAINYPFTLNFFGVIDTSTDPAKIYEDRVLTLLSTNIGQRPMLPNYGTNLGAALFENENDLTIAIDQTIRTAVANWVPEVSIDSIIIGTIDPYTGEAPVEINLILPDSLLTTISTTTAIINYDGTVTKA